VERAGLSNLNEGAKVSYEEMENRPALCTPALPTQCRINVARPMVKQLVAGTPLGRLGAARGYCRSGDVSCLQRRPLGGLGQAFLAGIQPLIADAWSQSAAPDFAHPRTRGEPPADLDNSLRFGGGLLRLAARDPAIQKLMIGVRQLIEPLSALGDPALVRRVESGMMADT
jgi:hypothetical protein